MTYLFGFFGFCAGFYTGLMMLKPALRRVSKQDLITDKSLAWRVGWIPWLMALIGLAGGVCFYDWVYLS